MPRPESPQYRGLYLGSGSERPQIIAVFPPEGRHQSADQAFVAVRSFLGENVRVVTRPGMSGFTRLLDREEMAPPDDEDYMLAPPPSWVMAAGSIPPLPPITAQDLQNAINRTRRRAMASAPEAFQVHMRCGVANCVYCQPQPQ